MRYTFFVILLIGIGKVGLCQSQSVAPIKEDNKLDKNCIYRANYSEKERNMNYPFNISDTVKLVSFRYHNNNQFTDVLYNNVTKNFGKSNAIHIGSVSQCFDPRNAVLFIDKTGKLKAYVLICFHCRRFLQNPEKPGWNWDFCDQKFEMIRQFFISTGIRYGTDLSVNEFPGELDE